MVHASRPSRMNARFTAEFLVEVLERRRVSIRQLTVVAEDGCEAPKECGAIDAFIGYRSIE